MALSRRPGPSALETIARIDLQPHKNCTPERRQPRLVFRYARVRLGVCVRSISSEQTKKNG